MIKKSNVYETVIGLEMHVQLATRSKIFCADSAAFGGGPNTHVGPVSLAHPGTLPRLNREAVEYAIRLGLALGCRINPYSTFDRKNYFYADLPKGYQITQDKYPVCTGGALALGESQNTVRLHHIHLEEDAGKSLHDQDPYESLVDLNRAGVPLLEIVTEPDLRTAADAALFMEKMRRLVRWLGISDGNMEEGSMRCDVNVSVRKVGETRLGQRCEIKNINSMRFSRKAIEFEAERQIGILEKGGSIEQETRGFDPATGITFSLREKEFAHDYRYFPDPDLPPVRIAQADIERIRATMLPLPEVLEMRFMQEFGLSPTDAFQLTQELNVAQYFLNLLKIQQERQEPSIRSVANLVIHKLKPWCDGSSLALNENPVSAGAWCTFLSLIENKKISASMAYQRLFPALLADPLTDPVVLADKLNLHLDDDSDLLNSLAASLLAEFPEKVAAYKAGKKGLLGFFMGELMKQSKGKADPQAATALLAKMLNQ